MEYDNEDSWGGFWVCPHCQSDDLEHLDEYMEDGSRFTEMRCRNCGVEIRFEETLEPYWVQWESSENNNNEENEDMPTSQAPVEQTEPFLTSTRLQEEYERELRETEERTAFRIRTLARQGSCATEEAIAKEIEIRKQELKERYEPQIEQIRKIEEEMSRQVVEQMEREREMLLQMAPRAVEQLQRIKEGTTLHVNWKRIHNTLRQ